ncbi:hypothetical protein AYO39_01590 [Actinobacteria bacterium SCGC AG-212-D09]|nr:hypothetical protein AYO39_01590 [Actinobacteria bacterium SCGC AG-212-D09]
MDRLRDGQPAVVVVEGPAGIGKTELLASLTVAAARDLGALTLTASCARTDQGFPFGVVRQLFEEIWKSASAGGAPQGPAAHAWTVFDPSAQGSDPDAAHVVLDGLYWLTMDLAENRSLVLAIDDVHWSDAESLQFVEFVHRRLEGRPVLVALAARSGEPGASSDPLTEIATSARTTHVRPGPLSRDAVRELLVRHYGEAPDEAFVDACYETTRGVPFFIVMLLVQLDGEAIVPTQAHASKVGKLGARAVGAAVESQLRALGSRAFTLAQAVAVSNAFGLTELQRELAISSAELLDAGEQLVRRGIFADATRPRFVHPLVRDAVLDRMQLRDRLRWQSAAARSDFEAGEPAHIAVRHLVELPGNAFPWALAVLTRAADWAMVNGAYESAATYLTRALDENAPGSRKDQIRLQLGRALARGGDPSGAIDILQPVAMNAREASVRHAARLESANLALTTGDPGRATNESERLLDDLGQDSDSEVAWQTRALFVAGHYYGAAHLYARTTPSVQVIEQRLGDSLTSPGRRCAAAVLATNHSIYGDEQRARFLASSALGRGLLTDGGPSSLFVLLALVALCHADALDDRAPFLDALLTARGTGSRLAIAHIASAMCLFHFRRGEMVDLERYANEAVDFGSEVAPFPALLAAGMLAVSLVEQGRLQDAHRIVDAPVLPQGVGGHMTDFAAYVKGVVALNAGAHAEAAELLEAGCSGALFDPVQPPTVSGFLSPVPTVQAMLLAGERRAAAEFADRVLALADAAGRRRFLGQALHAAALARPGGPSIDELRHAVVLLREQPGRLDHARCLYDLGAALRRRRAPAEARQHLRDALRMARELGARALFDGIRAELLSTGLRITDSMATGVESLTARELRVAALAADGMTNRQIATMLYITTKTVETHLSHVYQKLHITRRSELPGAMAGAGA